MPINSSEIFWRTVNDSLYAEIVFKDFKQAISFINAIAVIAEEMDHHPQWSNCYNRVEIKLTTHSAGNKITDKDRQMAAAIEELYLSHNQA
ncbi:MAG: hypothetical protein RIQ89_1596 [Bacteroidota bacterium]|jgi:4a-hydroxytetrahydrobiopterin dehydratase